MRSDRRNRLAGRLAELEALPERLVLGLSSGTSHDGIDSALVRIRGHGERVGASLIAFHCFPFSEEIGRGIARVSGLSTPELARLHFALGEAFAAAALDLLESVGVAPGDVHLVGSHGQTVFHEPPGDRTPGATMQIGEADIVAARTGVLTVSDFRTADVAVGGSGAPLIPLVDWLLFRDPGRARLMLNIGGIANVTWVVDAIEEVRAFDTGPGNSLIDLIVAEATGGVERYDSGGARAAAGRVDESAVRAFLGLPYFRQPPPKSTGRELFGVDAARDLAALVRPNRAVADLADAEIADLLATATAVTARSVRDSVRFLPAEPALSEVVVSGGGARNATLVAMLSDAFAPTPVVGLEDLGMDPDAKEAVGFAVLANETLFGGPGNLEAATGAGRRVVLGKLSPGF